MKPSRPDLSVEKYVSLATYRKSGAEVRTPVWIAEVAGHFYVFSAGNAGKVKRISANSEVKLAACDVRGNVRGDWLNAQARIVSDPIIIAIALKALRKKYGLLMYAADAMATLSGRFNRRAYIEIGLAAA